MTAAELEEGLLAGDFSRLAPELATIERWYQDVSPAALEEAFSCACFNGDLPAVRYLLAHEVSVAGGNGTGSNALHWAANRGQREVVELLIARGAPLESKNRFGGTVLDGTVWSAIHEPRPDHMAILGALLAAGADPRAVELPTGDLRIDALIAQYRR